MLYSIIDVETTGGKPSENKITEIAIILFDGNQVVDEFQTLVNPEKKISWYVTRLTGITDQMVESAPKFYQIANKVANITKDAVFVAHNVSFDYGVIRNEFKLLGNNFNRERLCTVRLSRQVFPGYRSYSLGNICNSLQIPLEDRHRAYGDAFATVNLFKKIIRQDESFIKNQLQDFTKENNRAGER